jgi:DNA polymerase V
METKVETVYKPDRSTKRRQPLFMATVPAGFPSPAADYEEGKLDLNKHLIRNPAATFFVRVTGDSMLKAGIHSGDLLVVDRSIEPRDKNVVIAVVNGELTVKRIRIRKNRRLTLEAENDAYQSQEINEQIEFEVWGVVTNVIHEL